MPNGSNKHWLKRISFNVLELAESTRTALDAAHTLNCQVGQIVKSLVFVIEASQEPILLLVSGKNQVNEKNVQQQIGLKLKKRMLILSVKKLVLLLAAFLLWGISILLKPLLTKHYCNLTFFGLQQEPSLCLSINTKRFGDNDQGTLFQAG